jgi:hypothetical protein
MATETKRIFVFFVAIVFVAIVFVALVAREQL